MEWIDSAMDQGTDHGMTIDSGQSRTATSFKMVERRDVPLLLMVRNATFITHEQLLTLLVNARLETNRRSFLWRVKRLLEVRYIRSVGLFTPYSGKVYAITRLGLSVLEAYGEGLISVTSDSKNLPNAIQAPHFLELNEIRQTLQRAGSLRRWRSERELSSLNYVIGTPLAKDYDAVAELDCGGELLRIAIEYERTLKSSARYQEIKKSIRDEGQVDMVLYLTSTADLIFTLSAEFRNPGVPMCFASVRKFRMHALRAMTLFSYGAMRETISIEEAIQIILPLKI